MSSGQGVCKVVGDIGEQPVAAELHVSGAAMR
jgi:hypothetical protein